MVMWKIVESDKQATDPCGAVPFLECGQNRVNPH